MAMGKYDLVGLMILTTTGLGFMAAYSIIEAHDCVLPDANATDTCGLPIPFIPVANVSLLEGHNATSSFNATLLLEEHNALGFGVSALSSG